MSLKTKQREGSAADRLPDRLPVSPRRERVWSQGFRGLRVGAALGASEGRSVLGASVGGIIRMENMSPRAYPSLAVRRPRERFVPAQNHLYPHGMAVMNGRLYFVEGNMLFRTSGGVEAVEDGVSVELLGTVENSAKRMAVFGDRLCIFPDKVYVDAADGSLHSMELLTDSIPGVELRADTVTLPEGLTWTALGFGAGDGLELLNRDDVTPAPVGHYGIRRVQGRVAYLTRSFSAVYTSTVAFRRPIPALEGLCVSGNRLCGYVGRDIYVSAEGTPLSWYVPLEEGAGGAVLHSATEGVYTACAAWQGYVVFFKVGRIARLMGGRADSFALSEVRAPGIPAALSETLCEVGGALYYHGDAGVYRYGQDGQQPVRIARLPGGRASGGCGGSDGICYYLYAETDDSDDRTARRNYVYAPEWDAWYAEDDRVALHMTELDGYLCRQDTDGHLWLTRSDGRRAGCTVSEDQLYGPLRASVTFAPDHSFAPDGYRPAGLYLRTASEAGGELRVLGTFGQGDMAAPDESDALTLAVFAGGSPDRLLHAPILPRPCDSLTLCLEMTGDWRIDAAVREYEARV